MLKPITTNEKLNFTLQLQADKATNEILSELYYDEKYNGLVDIWPILTLEKRGLRLEVQHKKITNPGSQLSASDAVRFQVSQDKGIRRVTTISD